MNQCIPISAAFPPLFTIFHRSWRLRDGVRGRAEFRDSIRGPGECYVFHLDAAARPQPAIGGDAEEGYGVRSSDAVTRASGKHRTPSPARESARSTARMRGYSSLPTCLTRGSHCASKCIRRPAGIAAQRQGKKRRRGPGPSSVRCMRSKPEKWFTTRRST